MRKNRSAAQLACLVLSAACGAAFLLQAVLLPLHQRQALELAWRQEVESVQAVSGAILTAHPELEGEIADLLREDSPVHREAGAQVLERYGYRIGRPAAETERYRAIGRETARRQWLFVATALLLCALIWIWKSGGERGRGRRVAAVLDSYLSGDYSFAQAVPTGGRRTGLWQSLEEELRRLGAQIRLQQSRLVEEKEATKGLVTDISHQLKTPIAALKTCFSLYLEAEEAEERQEFQGRCLLQMDKLEALTAALMNISRLESAMIALRPEPVSLHDLLVEAVGGIFDKAADKNIGVEIDPFADVTLPLDRRWTAEAILNVLDNAVKYSPPGSGIRISVQERQSFVRIEITDSGIGIPKEEQTRIFQRFFRGNHDAVRTSEGAGVGLYLTRAILEDEGGSVHVRSLPGEGSTFVIQLFREL